VIAFATDTLYGLAADPRRDDAVEKVFDAKGRGEHVPVPLIAADLDQARDAGEFGALELRLAQQFWPGALTIVVAAHGRVARRVLAGGSTVGIRVPAHEVARALCASMGSCLTATSANLAGHPAPASATEIDPVLAARIDAVLDSGPAPGGPPSTIVDVSSGQPRLVRAGAIAWDRVIKSLE
jgi:L-threonylcarbamoyladenylate synthase